MWNKTVGIWFVLSLLLLSCGKQPMYDKSYSFKGNKWEQSVKPVFKVNIEDTSVSYDFMMTLRVTTDYGFNNVWIYLNSKTPNGVSAREPFELKITNPDGTWIGKKTGTIVETELFFKSRKLPMKGEYTFSFEQGITRDVLPEVLDIGLRVTPSQEK